MCAETSKKYEIDAYQKAPIIKFQFNNKISTVLKEFNGKCSKL